MKLQAAKIVIEKQAITGEVQDHMLTYGLLRNRPETQMEAARMGKETLDKKMNNGVNLEVVTLAVADVTNRKLFVMHAP